MHSSYLVDSRVETCERSARRGSGGRVGDGVGYPQPRKIQCREIAILGRALDAGDRDCRRLLAVENGEPILEKLAVVNHFVLDRHSYRAGCGDDRNLIDSLKLCQRIGYIRGTCKAGYADYPTAGASVVEKPVHCKCQGLVGGMEIAELDLELLPTRHEPRFGHRSDRISSGRAPGLERHLEDRPTRICGGGINNPNQPGGAGSNTHDCRRTWHLFYVYTGR